MMLVGGTGCGKSTLFYHIIEQIKKKMTRDDVMIILIVKAIFIRSFIRRMTVLLETRLNILSNLKSGMSTKKF